MPAPDPGADPTPRRALRHFIDACREGDYAGAASILDLPPPRTGEGPRLARQLKFVLDRQVWFDWDLVSDEPEGDPADGAGSDVVGEVRDGGPPVPVRLVRQPDGRWLVGKSTVNAIPRLYQRLGPGRIAELLPPFFFEARLLEVEAWQWLGIAAGLALASFAALVLGGVARAVALRLARRTRSDWDDRLVTAASGPGRLLVAIGALALVLPELRLSLPAEAVAGHVLRTTALLAFTWAGLRGVGLLADLATTRLAALKGGAARGTATRVMVLRRVAGVAVGIVGGALVLLQFEALRTLGTSLLASAGVAGIVVGLAAQRSIGTLLAGLQISIAEPFRVGDVVVMEGEWGTVEEITLTYVVLKAWDLRRIVIPIGRVLDTPFQNWSRAGTEILGTVMLHADYGVPVGAVREEVQRFARSRPEWDGRVAELQVTDATPRTIELRALVSAPDAGKAWDLRCALREDLVQFLQRLDDGRHLPRLRLVDPEHMGPQGGDAR
ncbi:MAG: mechanosensitive ion channel [Deltaproteobacteria bacterium]|nr:mechanosensitive ion channel [Deltaproteobacteria bacterium]